MTSPTPDLSLAGYLYAQGLITRQMAQLAAQVIRRMGVPANPAERRAVARVMYPRLDRARRQSYVLAARSMRTQLPDVVPAPLRPYPIEALEQTIADVIDDVPDSDDLFGDDDVLDTVDLSDLDDQLDDVADELDDLPDEIPEPVREKPRVRIVEGGARKTPRVRVVDNMGARLARHAHAAGRDAVVDTAEKEDSRVGWARVLSGAENCAWCTMLASRGPDYRSENSALFASGKRGKRRAGETYHDHCDCKAVLVRKGEDWPGREQHELLEDLWREATKGHSGRHAVNALRRQLYRADRDGLTHQELLDALREENKSRPGGGKPKPRRRKKR